MTVAAFWKRDERYNVEHTVQVDNDGESRDSITGSTTADWIFNENGHDDEFNPYSTAGGRVGFEGGLIRKSHTARELLLHGHSYMIGSVEEGRVSDYNKQEAGAV